MQRELDGFYKEVIGTDFNIRHVSKGGFTQARAKLAPHAFVELNDNVNTTFYDQAPYLGWHNMRLLSCDGSRLMLPNHKSIREEFGEHHFGPNANCPRSLALCSFLYDPINLLTVDAQLTPYASGERDLLYQHLEKVRSGDLLLLDRGYPSLALMFELQARGIHFCMRMKENWWLEVKQFVESNEKQELVSFKLPKKDKHLLAKYPHLSSEIPCRLICIELDNGEKEILCTSLTDIDRYPYEDFAELYHLRWNIEEGYKLFKARVEVENFSGKTARAVKQDFFAKVFMMSLCAVLAFPIEDKVRREAAQEKTKYKLKINRTAALSMTGNISIGLFIKKTFTQAIQAFDNIVQKTLEIVRPNRKFERKKRPKRLYHMNYKRL